MNIHSIIKKWKTPNCYNNNYEIPNTVSGVYVIIMTNLDIESGHCRDKELVYIGMAKNLHKRYIGHEILKILRAMFPKHHTGFYFIETSDYKNYEKELIKYLNPKINKQNG